MPEIQVKDKLITLEELGAAIDAKAGVTSVNSQTGAVSITPANIGAVKKSGDTMTGTLTMSNNNQHYWVSSAGDRRWIVCPNAAGNEFYIATQEKVNGEWANWRGVLVAHPDGTIAINQPLETVYGGTGMAGVTGSRVELAAGQNITNKNTNIRKWGKIGVLTLYFEVTAQINQYAHIFTATSGYKPDGEYNLCVSDLNGKSYPIYYNADGILFNRVAMPAGNYYGNLSFFVQ